MTLEAEISNLEKITPKKGTLAVKKGTHSPAVGIPLIPHSNIQGGAPRPGCSQHTWTERHL